MKRPTYTEIAEASHVTPQFISQVVAGKKRPKWKTAKKISSFTGTPAELWMEGSPDQIKAALAGVCAESCASQSS